VKRRGPIAVVLVAAALALAASAAATRTVYISSKVSIKSAQGLKFVGHVTSPNHACEEGRKVVLLRVIENGPDQALGHDVTNDKGNWSIEPSGFAGISMSHFYARVKRRSEGTAGTIYVCKGDRSRTIELGM
jgi:hypothetical protein